MMDNAHARHERGLLVNELNELAESLNEAAFSLVRAGHDDNAEQVAAMGSVLRIYADRIRTQTKGAAA